MVPVYVQPYFQADYAIEVAGSTNFKLGDHGYQSTCLTPILPGKAKAAEMQTAKAYNCLQAKGTAYKETLTVKAVQHD